MTKEELRKTYAEVCDEYLRRFCERHRFSLLDAYWIRDERGGVAEVADYFFAFEDIRYDVDNEVPGDTIIDWYDYSLRVYELEQSYRELERCRSFIHINYENWCKGAPKPYGEEELEEMESHVRR